MSDDVVEQLSTIATDLARMARAAKHMRKRGWSEDAILAEATTCCYRAMRWWKPGVSPLWKAVAWKASMLMRDTVKLERIAQSRVGQMAEGRAEQVAQMHQPADALVGELLDAMRLFIKAVEAMREEAVAP